MNGIKLAGDVEIASWPCVRHNLNETGHQSAGSVFPRVGHCLRGPDEPLEVVVALRTTSKDVDERHATFLRYGEHEVVCKAVHRLHCH